MSISEKLWDSLEDNDCDLNEVVQLMSLDEEELSQRFASNVNLRIRYLKEPNPELSFVAETQDYSEPETEEESSDDDTFHQIRMERGESSRTK